jgi:uncharacterized damage-inducible protein DinB
MKDFLFKQYELVKDSRSVLFDYCDTISPENFIKVVEGFGRGGSISSLLAHVANSSQYWIAFHCFKENHARITTDSVNTVADFRALYKKIDLLVERLIETFENDYLQELSSVNDGTTYFASPFKVFTHSITHEYHHKGQMLSISRQLGYIPVDTDIIR